MGIISIELAIAIITLLVVPVLLWCWYVTLKLKGIDELLEMHKDADKYGFGNVKTNQILEEMQRTNEQLMIKLIHYIKFIAEQASNGKGVPPPDPDI